MNEAFVTKIAWQICNNKNKLWINVLKSFQMVRSSRLYSIVGERFLDLKLNIGQQGFTFK